MTNNIQGNSHKVISWHFIRNSASQKGMAYFLIEEREKLTTKKILPRETLIQI